jgi:signal transduction histidine kinase
MVSEFPPKDMGKIFDRFYRGGAEAVKKAGGSGVGLYLARKILEEQGGSVIADSREGHGSKFTILCYFS